MNLEFEFYQLDEDDTISLVYSTHLNNFNDFESNRDIYDYFYEAYKEDLINLTNELEDSGFIEDASDCEVIELIEDNIVIVEYKFQVHSS